MRLNVNKKNKLFWSVYIFILLGFVILIDSTDLLITHSLAESMIITFFLLIIGIVFKKWFDEWYKNN